MQFFHKGNIGARGMEEMAFRVLIADDNPDSKWIFSVALGFTGFEVTETSDGSETIQYLGNTVPDVLILDLNMPKSSGYDVLNHIRQSGKPDLLRIIVVTGDAIAARYLDQDLVDLVLIKPVDPVTLAALAHRLVQDRKPKINPSETQETTPMNPIDSAGNESKDNPALLDL
jgi:two-component system response regulator AdeR